MAAPIPIRAWHWAGFILGVILLVALDLGVFQRGSRPVRMRQALRWSAVWFSLALLFAGALARWRSPEESLQFLTGYLIEFSLSLDNVFAMAVIFGSFGVAPELRHGVLFWGVAGALLMRGLMIGVGAALLASFHWLLYLLGAFLVIAGVRWGIRKQPFARPQDNPVIRLARRLLPVSAGFDGARFVTVAGGRRMLTPLALVLLAVETADLIFALDSIPAVLAVTQKAFIVFTSNIFAILGLRSLYFVLSGAMEYFRYLRAGLAVVLVLIGLKMLAAPWYSAPASLSLAVVLAIVAVAMTASLLAARRR
jgi:tellurite resistance protein TerC